MPKRYQIPYIKELTVESINDTIKHINSVFNNITAWNMEIEHNTSGFVEIYKRTSISGPGRHFANTSGFGW